MNFKKNILLLIIVVLFSACGEESTESNSDDNTVSLSKGLVAHYEFEGNVLDSSGNENHGKEYGNVTYVKGVMGQAIDLDGIDDYIRITNKNLDKLKEFTISLYFLPVGSGGNIFDSYSWNNTKGKGFRLTLNSQEGAGVSERTNGELLWFGTLFDEGWFNNRHKFIKTQLDKDNFLHVCAVYKNGEEKLYINGVLKVSHTIEHKFDLGNYDYLIGTNFRNHGNQNVINSHSGTLKGQMDEFRFYNRALNESEVKELYHIGL